METMLLKTELKLVESHGGVLMTNSLIMAEMCLVKHKNALTLIRKYESDLSEVGRVAFQTRPFETPGGMQSQEIALLDDYAAILLMTHMRSNSLVAGFKKKLVAEFKRMKEIQSDPSRVVAVSDKRKSAHAMTESLLFIRDLAGKDTLPHHYGNEHLFSNRALTGKGEALDEAALDAYDLKLLEAIRIRNTILIQHHPVQKDRKKLLDEFVAEYKVKKPRLRLVGK